MAQAQQVGLKSRSCRGNYADTIVFYVRSRSPKIVALLYKLPIPVEGASDVTKQPQKDVVSVLFVGKQTRLDGSLTVDAISPPLFDLVTLMSPIMSFDLLGSELDNGAPRA